MEVENYPDLWYRKTEEEKYNLALQRAGQFLVRNLWLIPNNFINWILAMLLM